MDELNKLINSTIKKFTEQHASDYASIFRYKFIDYFAGKEIDRQLKNLTMPFKPHLAIWRNDYDRNWHMVATIGPYCEKTVAISDKEINSRNITGANVTAMLRVIATDLISKLWNSLPETERFLLEKIKDEPDDQTNRLVYADWLEENGRNQEAAYQRQV